MSSAGNGCGLGQFPITGTAICNELRKALRPDDELLITDIETLCSGHCNDLGNLWRNVVEGGAVKMHADKFLKTLEHAHQVISLSVHLIKNDSRRMVIDDGELVENRLTDSADN